MKQNGYGYTPTNWLLSMQDLLLSLMFLIHAMAGRGIYCLEYALTYLLSLNELSGKEDAVAGTIPYSDSPNDVRRFTDYSNARKRKGMKNCNDAKMQSIDGYQWKELLIPLGKFQ